MKKLFSWSNLASVAFAILIIVVVVNPQAKALILQGLMKVGLFKAPVENTEATKSSVTHNTLPDLALIAPDGKQINLKDQKRKVIIINFWATWCPPCIAEMPSINVMYGRYKNNPKVLFLSVDADNDFSKSVPFMQRHNYSFPVYNIAGPLPEGMIYNAIPTTIIIDKNGTIVARHEGAADYADDSFYKYIDGLIAQ
ncbi:MAG: TlpA disulfide reductase family protein [Bacteroidota bacterium]